MSKTDPYFTFPLSALQMAVSPANITADVAEIRARELRCLSIITGAAHLSFYKDPTTIRAMAANLGIGAPDWMHEDEPLAASMVLHRCAPEILPFDTASDFAEFAKSIQHRLCGPCGNKLVRIRADIIDDVVGGNLTWRQFVCLAAVYASCSARKPAPRLVREQLIAMASGYTGHHIARAAGINADRFLTTSQIKTTLDQLQAARFFARVSLGRRAYFSNLMGQAALEEVVAGIEAKRILSEKESSTVSNTVRRVRLRAAQIAKQVAKPVATTGKPISGKASLQRNIPDDISTEIGGPAVLPEGLFEATHQEKLSTGPEISVTQNAFANGSERFRPAVKAN